MPTLLDKLAVISDAEENRYSDIPKWEGLVAHQTDAAVLLLVGGQELWFPLSHLRIAEDRQSLYASDWILKQHDL
jgi:hypothetical protein